MFIAEMCRPTGPPAHVGGDIFLGDLHQIRDEMKSMQNRVQERWQKWDTSWGDASDSTSAGLGSQLAKTVSVIQFLCAEIDRNWIHYGTYPENEEEMEVMGISMLQDPFTTGSPLRYERTGDRVYVWSVGPDGKDDRHATIWKPGRSEGDIVASRPWD